MADKPQDKTATNVAAAPVKPVEFSPRLEVAKQEASDFRRQVALAVLTAYLTRHGGFGNKDAEEATARQIWRFADIFIAAEHAKEPEPEAKQPAALRRPVRPDDEWAVVEADGTMRRRSFGSPEEAEAYAAGRPGARVKQMTGSRADSLAIAK
jgi:hypothetical protein